MSKLFELKEWVTLDEAAIYISKKLGESFTLADIYRLALDGHLNLSANFFNCAVAKKVSLIKSEDVKYGEKYNNFLEGASQEVLSQISAQGFKNVGPSLEPTNAEFELSGNYWVKETFDRLYPIKGLWDLTMFGDEKLDIEHRYHQLTSGLAINEHTIGGVYIQRGSLVMQLQTSFNSKPHNEAINTYEKRNVKFNCEHASEDEFRQDLKAYGPDLETDEINSRVESFKNRFYRASGLDDQENTLVVRVKEVTRFIQSLEETPAEAKPLSSKERNSLLVLLGAVCKHSNIEPSQRGIATSLVAMTELIGAPLTDDTIRKILNQIQPAIESRSK